ncbi:hypothetical protein A6R73_07200 [Xanthomonas translucens pv. poae]|uniref:Uncharacterized protein n=1 Tax=Xanthomonas graminis pv. poae TaxID=227946 RepID=A0A199NX15_9XANT|nr:hypothetical protein A6R73_07200 [Xanthomonas translucens pv. poae]
MDIQHHVRGGDDPGDGMSSPLLITCADGRLGSAPLRIGETNWIGIAAIQIVGDKALAALSGLWIAQDQGQAGGLRCLFLDPAQPRQEFQQNRQRPPFIAMLHQNDDRVPIRVADGARPLSGQRHRVWYRSGVIPAPLLERPQSIESSVSSTSAVDRDITVHGWVFIAKI